MMPRKAHGYVVALATGLGPLDFQATEVQPQRLEFVVGHFANDRPGHVALVELTAFRRYAGAQRVSTALHSNWR